MFTKKQGELELTELHKLPNNFSYTEPNKRECKKTSFSSLCFGSIVAPADSPTSITTQQDQEETALGFYLEILFPFLFAGFGMVGAGILFDTAQSWEFFQNLPEAVVLVPALLGLKGNLEMTLGSRLSTQANLGKMNTRQDQLRLTCSNLSLVQAQAILISLSAAIFTAIYEGLKTETWKSDSYVLLCLTSVATASITSLILGFFMIAVVIISLKIKVNPDNVTTPIAASLGDVTTLLCMICIGSLLLQLQSHILISLGMLCLWILSAIFCMWVAAKDENARNVLKYGWYAIVTAMLISSGSGMILQKAVMIFPSLAPFQPVINGVGGNIVAIQASRISTCLHKNSEFGKLAKKTLRKSLSPIRAFLSKDANARAARVLLFMIVPGHLIFLGLIFAVVPSTLASVSFVVAYLFVAILQVLLLLYMCQIMVPVMWRYRIDPDNSAIPILTAIGDLLGITLLFTASFLHQKFFLFSNDNDVSGFTTDFYNSTDLTFQTQ